MSVLIDVEREVASTRVPVPKRPRPSVSAVGAWSVLAALGAAAVWSLVDLGINLTALVTGFENAHNFIARMFPLEFPTFAELLDLTVYTIAITIVATVLAVVVSIPLAVWSAKPTAPAPWAVPLTRIFVVVMRAIPEVVLAIIFFRLFGLGALPGILAIGLGSIGMVAKLYADAIEELDQGPPQALRATGASRRQMISSAVHPALVPQLLAITLHRFDINLRGSVILGYVGIGGIGLAMSEALNTMQYQKGMALALIVLILCMIVELISNSLRAVLLSRGSSQGFAGWLDRASGGWVHAPMRATEPARRRNGRIRVSPPLDGARLLMFFWVGVTALLVVGSVIATWSDSAAAFAGLVDLPRTLALFWPPSSGGLLGTLTEAMLVTVQIGLAATLIGVVCAVPVGALAARNVAPNAIVSTLFRTIIVVVRAFPELILAIILIVMMGLGPIPGAIALGIGSIGLLGKLFADSLEETDLRVQEAVRLNGATRLQVFTSVTMKQVLPALIAHVLYQLDNNVRAATLLGIVGAGGIGFYLLDANRVQMFDVVTFMLIMIVVVVLALEGLSAWIRRTII